MAILNETQGDKRVPTGERFYEKALHKGARRLAGYCNRQARFAVDWLQIQRRGNYWLNF
jgi:hypothetical protein